MITLYVIRHGQTDWNIENRLQGSTDIPLNSTGHEQAKIAAKKLEDIRFDIIISSPLERALDTAKHVDNFKNTKLITDSRLIERSFGLLEGKTGSDLKELNFSITELLDYSYNYDKYNVETIHELFSRIEDFIEYIKNNFENQTVLISTHNGVSQVLDVILNRLPKTTNLLDVSFKNCEFRRYLLND